jgi:hypothetical protein
MLYTQYLLFLCPAPQDRFSQAAQAKLQAIREENTYLTYLSNLWYRKGVMHFGAGYFKFQTFQNQRHQKIMKN